MTRTPPSYADAPSSAPPRIAEGVFLFNAAGSKDETPKRGRGIESPRNKNRKTPPKKSKTVTSSSPSTSELMMELGGILGEIIYMVEDKKPAVRHIIVDMKNMLKRMKQIQQTVSDHLERDPNDTQHTNGCPKCDSAQHQKTRCVSPATITSGKQATKSLKARNTEQAAPSTPRKQDNGSFVSDQAENTANAITDSKKRCFQELPQLMPMPSSETTLDTIVVHLFPQQPPLCALVHLPDTTASEVLDIAANIKPGKAPGPDGTPNSVLKTIIAAHPNVFVDMFNRCLVERTIPYRWKKQKLVLIPKADVIVRARSDAMREAIILRAMSKAIRCQSESFA
ncbi:hypothetical protein ACLKA6_001111 [Drosophila palustris]